MDTTGVDNGDTRRRIARRRRQCVTPFFRPIAPVGRSPIGVAFGILWNGCVYRANVATLNRVALWISRTMTHRPLHRRVSSIRPSTTHNGP